MGTETSHYIEGTDITDMIPFQGYRVTGAYPRAVNKQVLEACGKSSV
jgi:hypothetical protein